MADSFSSCVKGSEIKAWKLDEILPENSVLDLKRQFIALNAKAPDLLHLGENEVLLLSQILASCYTYLIHIVEEFIVDQVVSEISSIPEHADQLRALSRFLDEEIKHQQLFGRFNEILQRDLGQKIEMPNTGPEFAKRITEHNPLAVWLLTLHTEVMTQAHYTTIFKSTENLEPKLIEILKFHWTEEAIHVRVDALEIEHLRTKHDANFKQQATKDYFRLLSVVDAELIRSANAVVENFYRIVGSNHLDKKDRLRNFVLLVLRNFLIFEGVRHPMMVKVAATLETGMENQIANVKRAVGA